MDWSGHFKLQLNWEKLADIFLTCWVSLEFRVAFWNILDHKFDQTPGHDADPISGGELRFHNKDDNPTTYGSPNLSCSAEEILQWDVSDTYKTELLAVTPCHCDNIHLPPLSLLTYRMEFFSHKM